MKGRYSVTDITGEFTKGRSLYQLSIFTNKRIVEVEAEERWRTAQTYRTTLNTFMTYRKGQDIDFESIDSDMMSEFEKYLFGRGLCRNTTSFYMRILSALYKKAVKKRLCEDKHPFKNVYLGVDKTMKRAVDENVITKLMNYESTNENLLFARDMFLFSFYCRGIPFVDLFHLKRDDISNGKLTYCRSKTKQYLTIKIEPCMKEIIDRYKTKEETLFPFKSSKSKNGKHTTALWLYNERLRKISKELNLRVKLSSYVSRHTWASIAKQRGVTTSIISECLGHTNERTTQIYLTSFPQGHLDKANRVVLRIGKN